MEMPPESKGDTLSDERDGGALVVRVASVFEDDERGRLMGAGGDAKQAAHAHLRDLTDAEIGEGDAGGVRGVLCALGEDGRGHAVGRLVRKVTREGDGLRDDRAPV